MISFQNPWLSAVDGAIGEFKMPESDPLDRETSISGELTEGGAKGTTNSRFVAAIDRLGGNLVDLINLSAEERTSRRRAKIEGERKIINALADMALGKIGSDEEFARRALENHFGKIVGSQANRDGVLIEAFDDLKRLPSSNADEGDEAEISEVFLNRLDHYASEATTEELRHRWGRVLAAEIRTPGTFTQKVLRVVDEMDSETARIFENICEHRIGNCIPKGMIPKLSFNEKTDLVLSGLLTDSGIGIQRQSQKVTDGQGFELFFVGFGDLALAVSSSIQPKPLTAFNEFQTIIRDGDKIAFPCELLTPEGVAIATILDNHERAALKALGDKIANEYPNVEVRIYQRRGEQWTMLEKLPIINGSETSNESGAN